MCKLILISLFLITATLQHNILIEYSFSKQNAYIFKYLHGIGKSFYVDIGAHNPVFLCNSVQLYSDGWKGLNVDANPTYLTSFTAVRKNEVNLNTAVGDSNQFITFYRMNDDVMSTISEEVKQNIIDKYNQTAEEMKVPSISLQTLCNNYFWQRPKFLNIDTVGYGSKALISNDWSKQNCRPEVIMSEFVQFNEISGLETPESILKANNYTLIQKEDNKQIFISNELVEEYKAIGERNQKLLDSMQIINNSLLNQKMKEYFNIDDLFGINFDPKTSPMFIHYTSQQSTIFTEELKHLMHRYSSEQNRYRPILILEFHTNNTIIIQEASSYTIDRIDLGDQVVFNRINVTNEVQNDTYCLLVFDQYQDGTQIKIIRLGYSEYLLEWMEIVCLALIIFVAYFCVDSCKRRSQYEKMSRSSEQKSGELQSI